MDLNMKIQFIIDFLTLTEKFKACEKTCRTTLPAWRGVFYNPAEKGNHIGRNSLNSNRSSFLNGRGNDDIIWGPDSGCGLF
jgi:hypothetical protein